MVDPNLDIHISPLRVTVNQDLKLTGMNEFGLENAAGHLNCFLNVILQSMWHLTPMRRFLTSFIQHDLSQTKKIDEEDLPVKPVLESLKVSFSNWINNIDTLFYHRES